MLRDQDGNPVDPTGAWFIHHGLDVEMDWYGGEPVPFHTPNDRFFVRNHSAAPSIDAETWRLVVHGDGVEGERSYGLEDLKALGTTSYDRALECTGNGRRLFESQQGRWLPGTQWGLGAVGLASWTGVPLSRVLADAGLTPDAIQVMAVGLDAPYSADGVDHGHVRRPLPLAKALDDVLLAWEMNGEPLPPEHGYPVRLVVPGWVGIASIKWLGSIEVQTSEVTSPWNTKWYRMHGEGYDGRAGELGRMPVKSMLDLAPGATVRGAETTTLTGRAWAGEAWIDTVEVSVDGGTWQPAKLVGPNETSGMVCFAWDWTPETSGTVELRTRATDSTGRVQPEAVPANDDGYLFWAVVRREVEVVSTSSTNEGYLQMTVSDGV